MSVNDKNNLPILYSFRRCPYAIRARLALAYTGIAVEHREILLKNKPASMLAASNKGTVPVLILPNGKVIDESLDIMHWALQNKDSDNWYITLNTTEKQNIDALINDCDQSFKKHLDLYKYADRHPEFTEEHYRTLCEVFIQKLEQLLTQQAYLLANKITLADMAILPFIRQFASVDRKWFDDCKYLRVRGWLNNFLKMPLFLAVMDKRKLWEE